MCAICGIIGRPGVEVTKRMMKAMSQRGLDSEGKYCDSEVSLGACRLSAIDLKHGNQPIFNEDHRMCLVCDGRIHNYLGLRKRLVEKGHRFSTESDNEVILHLFEEEEENCVTLLKGMFAFAIWNGTELFIARDRLGMKPLFYALSSECFIFGSQIKALFQCDTVPRVIDEEVLCEQAVFGFPLELDSTLFKGIRQLPPGTTITVSRDQSLGRIAFRTGQYDRLDLRTTSSSDNSADGIIPLLQSTLEHSVQLHMQSDVPVGVMLSGGIDSSLLALLAAKCTDTALKTFTVSDSVSQPDVEYARKVAAQIGAEHHEFIISLEDLVGALPSLVLALEGFIHGGVFSRSGDQAFFLLAQRASEFAKIALCGEGADELFGGYWMHRFFLGYQDQLRERTERLKSSSRISGRRIEERIEVLGCSGREEETSFDRALRFFLQSPLTNYHLWATDRCSMWHGLEVRLPYLYDDLVRLATEMPSSLRQCHQVSKYALRKIAYRHFNEELLDILSRRKEALPSAFARLAQRLDHLCSQIISDQYVAKHPFGKYLWTKVDVLMFDLLHFLLIQNGGELPVEFDIFDLYGCSHPGDPGLCTTSF